MCCIRASLARLVERTAFSRVVVGFDSHGGDNDFNHDLIEIASARSTFGILCKSWSDEVESATAMVIM